MKKIISLICVLAFFLSLFAMPAGAEFYYKEHLIEYPIGEDGGVIRLVKYKHGESSEIEGLAIVESENLKGKVVIPETINGLPVTALWTYEGYGIREEDAFYSVFGNPEMTSLTLPSTLKRIYTDIDSMGCVTGTRLKELIFLGDGPVELMRGYQMSGPEQDYTYSGYGPGSSDIPLDLSGAENLERIVLPKKVRVFGLEGLKNLKEVVIDPSNPYYSMDDQGIIYNKDKTVLISAAQGAQDRTEVVIPDTVQEIKEHAFQYNTKLEKVSGGKNLVRGSFSPSECGEEFNPFLDTYGHWSEESAKWAFQTGTISGMTPVTFCPDKKLNRGMFVTMLNRAVRGGTVSGGLIFTDVPLTAYYRVPLKWAVACKVVTGVGGTRFAPEQNVTREQMAAMIYRYVQNDKGKRHGRVILDEEGMIQGQYYYELDYKSEARGDLTVFTDADRISSYAEEAMSWAVGTGILQGKNGGRLDPKGTATRAEAVTMIQRLEELEEEINIEKD